MWRFFMISFLIAHGLTQAGCARGASSPPPARPWQMTGGLEHAMMNCPSAVTGATTRVERTPDGVDVIVVAAEAGDREYVRELAEYHAHLGAPSTDRGEHSGFHGGPGRIGHCPIIHYRTQVTYSSISEGAIIHVKARSPMEVEQLQQETEQRARSLPRWLPH